MKPEALQLGYPTDDSKCAHCGSPAKAVVAKFLCKSCYLQDTFDPKSITPPRKQPYVKVRSTYHDGDKIIFRDVHVRLDKISLIEGPSQNSMVVSVIADGNFVRIHPDDYPALLAAFEAWHA